MNAKSRVRVALCTAVMLLAGACGASEAATLADAPIEVEASNATTSDNAAKSDPAPADAGTADEERSVEPTAVVGGAGSFQAAVTIDGESMIFEMLICSTFGPEFLGGTGLPGENAPADSEFVVSYEKPLPGDDESSEYDNTVTFKLGNDSWKAGSVTGGFAGEWGSLEWSRDGDVLSGTAELEHAWGVNGGDPRQASFVVNCTQ